jgi:hypothetical protein
VKLILNNSNYINYKHFANMKGTIYGNGLPGVKQKKKAIPLQAWTDPQGSKRWRFLDFKTIST